MLVDILNEQVNSEQVILFIINESYQKSLINQIDKRVSIVYINRKPESHSVWPIIKLNYQLLKLRPNVIHIHNSRLSAFIMPFICSKLFLTIHDLHISAKYTGRMKSLIAISEAVKQDINKRTKCLVVTIPNGIVIEKIARRALAPIKDKLKIIQIARLDAKKKGQDILIKAIALLKEKNFTHITVDFIGAGESEQMLKKMTQDLRITEQIHFLGLRDRNYIYSHLNKYDLMCHPARYEGFGLTIAEGMAAQLPVLVPNEGGPYEIINYGEFGYTFENDNIQECAAKIEFIYHNYQQVLDKVTPAFKHVSQCYSVKRMVKEYLQVYRS